MRATGPLVFSWIQRMDRGNIHPAVRRGRQYAGHHPDHHHPLADHADHHRHPHHADHHAPADQPNDIKSN